MDWRQPQSTGTITTGSPPGLQANTRTCQSRRNDCASSSLGKGSIRFGSAVVVEGSFQAFLAEQTKLHAATEVVPQPPPAHLDQTAPTTPAGQDTAETVHILQHGETIWELARNRYHLNPAVLLRHNNITSPGKLQAGTKIRIPGEHPPETPAPAKEVVAGWYGSYHQGRLMANGRRFNMHAATLAHRNMPIGTKVELENPKTGEKAQAVVTDRGPYHQGRDVDLSYGLAKRLSLATQGIGTLKMRVL